ncbi:MAG: hypothetical protein ACE5KT_07485, partial [Methanosarcinales archaeon]
WTKTAWNKLISREIAKIEVKECILFGDKKSTIQTPIGAKITKEIEVYGDPRYEALIVVYLETPTQYQIISNHLRRRKTR